MIQQKIPYPPYIEGIIPAFSGDIIKIPYEMNAAVGRGEYSGFNLRIKDPYTNSEIKTTSNLIMPENEENENILFFDVKDGNLIVGQYYKVQIAYENGAGIGAYSTVGVVKYTKAGSATIKGLEQNSTNLKTNKLIGEYQVSEEDIFEKEYEYEFNLYNSNYELLENSGKLLHNSESEQDEYYLNYSFENNQLYFVQYKIITLNGLEVVSPLYKIVEQNLIDGDYDFTLVPELNFDNGHVSLYLSTANDQYNSLKPMSVTGTFVLSRSSKSNNYNDWQEIYRVKFVNNTLMSKLIFKDFTVMQGETYKYNIQQYNKYNVYSKKTESNEIFVDFEDIFLFDGERQLKVRFNPKIASFKNTVLEQKTDTIGGGYPFIFRNGLINYKELSLSGLISLLMDEENLFFDANSYLKDPELENGYITTNLSKYNIANERKFKLEVLNWLNNGQPKLLRTATEGNYIVRLLNISLSPTDTVNRMLHTFNCQAYEIDELNWSNLIKYGFVKIDNPVSYSLQWRSVRLDDYDLSQKINHKAAINIKIESLPGTQFEIVIGDKVNNIIIGRTGVYEAFIPNGITSIICKSPLNNYTGVVTYSYYEIVENKFDKISGLNLQENIQSSIYGGNYYLDDQKKLRVKPINIIRDCIEDVKNIFSRWTNLSFRLREIKTLTDEEATELDLQNKILTVGQSFASLGNVAVFYVDPIIYKYNNISYDLIHYKTDNRTGQFYCVISNLANDDYRLSSEIQQNQNSTVISSLIGEHLNIPNPEDFQEIQINGLVIADVGYYFLTVEYDIESNILSYFSENERLNHYKNNPTIDNYLKNKFFYDKLIMKLKEQGVSEYEESYG